jgi:hypothetical protein
MFIGIDVSRDTLEVASSAQAASWRRANDTAGVEALCAELGCPFGLMITSPALSPAWSAGPPLTTSETSAPSGLSSLNESASV